MRKNIFGLLVLLFIVLLSSCTMVAEHEWSPWTITKEPTCMEEGERVSTCVLCDETKTEKVAKISHKLDGNNKCSMCGSYYVLSSAGNGETLVDKLKNALDGINFSSAESKVLYLESGEYDLSQIDDLSISASGLTIHGASSTDGTKTTFVVPSTKSLKVTGDSFALDNVAFSLTGDTSSSTEPVLSLTGDNATVKNSSFELGSHTNPAIGSISEGQTVTLDSVTISGGGTLNTEGSLVITDSNIKTTVSPAINGVKGDITIKKSKIEGSLTTSENLNSLTIEGSTLTNGRGEIKGTNVTIKDSTLNNWNLSVNAKTTTVANSTINAESIKITGATDSSATVENSNLTATDVVISAESNTITGSNINKGQKNNSLTIGGKTADIASSTLDGKVTVSTTEKTDIKENSSINASDTKSDGTFVVESGEITISDSKLGGDITFETGTKKATIENSTVDTSTGSNALTTGTSLEITGSTIARGSGLYVTKDAKNIDIEITNSSVSDGSNVDNITSENVTTEVFSKSVPEDKKSSVIALSDSQSSASLKVGTDYTSVPFTFKDSNENEIRVNVGKKNAEVNLKDFFDRNVTDYKDPVFYTDSDCENAITDSKITVVDAGKYKVGETVYDSIYVKWEYRVTYTDGEGKEKTEYTQEGGKFTISTPTKDGYVFDGWQYKNGNKLETTVSGGKVTVTLTSPSTLEPIWVKTYTVTFDVNGGNELTSDTMVVRTGETISKDDMPKPTYSGYTFDDWYTDEGKVFTCGVDKIEKDIRLHAKWLFSVTVKVGEEEKTYTGNSSEGITLAELGTPTKDGYTFNGWYTDPDLKNAAVDPMKRSMELYPAYVCEVTLSKDKTDGAEETSRDLTVDYNSQIKDVGFFDKGSSNKYISKTDRYFAGWYTKNADGTENKVTENTTITTGMTLYAKWNVSYKIGDGDEVEISEDDNTLEISALNNKVNKKDWEKVTWYSDGTDIKDSTVRITATQQKLTYTREYYKPDLGKQPSGFENATTVTEYKVDSETGKILTLPKYELDGFTFKGWYTADGEKYTVSEDYIVSDKTPDLKLTPVWSKTYTITYSTGYEGSLDSKDATAEYTRYYYEQDRLGDNDLNKTIVLPTPTVNESYTETKEKINTVRNTYGQGYYLYSYAFEGWKYKASDLEFVEAEELSESISKDVTLLASWKIVPEVGKIVLFGKHNEKPLEWVILNVDETNGRILVLSLCSLENRALDDSLKTGTNEYNWQNSQVCSWLNGTTDGSDNDFLVKYGLKKIYDDEKIVSVEHDNDEYKCTKDSDGKATVTITTGTKSKEKIFLLSYDEYKKYIVDNETRCMAMFHVGRFIGDSDKFVSWWLRTPNRSNSYTKVALCDSDNGTYIRSGNELVKDSVTDYDGETGNNKLNIGNIAVCNDDRFIRPAFWYKYK